MEPPAPIVLLVWLGANFGRAAVQDSYALFQTDMLLELPGLLGAAFFAATTSELLRRLDAEVAHAAGSLAGINPETGLFEANQLRPALESEIARARRFGRTFALVLVGIDEMRQRFDYRDQAALKESLAATARLLRQTRNVDRVFHRGREGFAMLLPESTEKDIPGMVRRLRRTARLVKPAEGEPGGPLPVHFGATFFPTRATTVEHLLKRAEISLHLAEKSTSRYQLDGAEAPDLAPPMTLRRETPVTRDEFDSIEAPGAGAGMETEEEAAPKLVAGVPGSLSGAEHTQALTPSSCHCGSRRPKRRLRQQARRRRRRT